MVRIVRATQVEIESAVQALRDGELVAFPTETVYGLGANAQNPAAVVRIFEAKGRPPNHPVIVHLDSPRFLHRWVREVPEAATRLAESFWPGPFTMVMPRAANVHDVITGGQDTIAIRAPAHPMAQQLLTAFGGGIAAPSANRYGRLSPTRAEHVREELGDAGRVILDGRGVGVLAQRLPLRAHKYATWINAGRRPENYGRDLYANLRTLDKAGCRRILVQAVPDGERWDAIRDRLVHAATSVAESDDGSGAMAVLP